MSPSTMEYVAKGEITATLSQDEFAQGHDPIINLFNNIVSGLGTLTAKNADKYGIGFQR